MRDHIKQILRDSKMIAVVGCSRNPEKEAYRIPKFMQEHGFKIVPVNPSSEQILGEKSYHSLTEIKENVDIVNIFRPSEEAEKIVREAVRLRPKLIWMQLGITNEKAAKIAEENAISRVMDKCIKVGYQKLFDSC